MKIFKLKLSSAIISLAVLVLPSLVNAQATGVETIKDYQVNITVNKDSSIRVEEKIAYDFGTAERHGIFRNIPYKYKARGGTFKLRVSDVTVKDESGKDYQFAQSNSGGDIELKIGDPNSTITGLHNYVISYTVNRAINYFDDHDELYWNAIGTEWEVPIEKSNVTVRLPDSSTNAQCYIGKEGSTETLCSITDNKIDTVAFAYSKALSPGEGFTISVGMPVGTLLKPTQWQKALDIFKDNGILGLPLLVAAGMFYIWRKYGKDAKGKGTVVAQYEPPKDLSPLYMGALVDGKVDNKDISAEIIYLAEQGYLTVERIETKKLIWFKGSDYKFAKIEKSTEGLMPQSKAVYEALFSSKKEVILSEFKSEVGFGKALMEVRSNIFKELTKAKYYRTNPRVMLTLFVVGGIIAGGVGAALLGSVLGAFGVVAAIASGLVILVFGFFMPALTTKGAEAKEYILGLKKYLGVAEKDRLEFHNAPQNDPKRFELLLPFAMALGVERLWAAQFKDIYNQKPSWYSDGSSASFNSAMLTSSMGDFSGSVQSAAASATSTASGGGSGFSGGGSGGGGGGGGGGSW